MKALRHIGFFLFCTLLFAVIAYAQLSPRLQQLRNITFDHIRIEQELPNGWVSGIIEDSRGFMWFGTSAGLCRYDGCSMLVYKKDELDSASISDNDIVTILEDQSRTILWIGTYNGLNAYNISTGKFTRFTADPVNPSSLSDNHVTSICQDRTGRLWIGTSRGVNEMTVDSSGHVKFIRYLNDPKDTNSLSGNTINDLCEGDDGMIWVGTGPEGGGINRFDTKTKRVIRILYPGIAPDQSANRIWAIRKDRNGILWVGTRGGVIRFDPRNTTFKQIRHDPANPYSPSSNNVNTLCIDQSGILWAGTVDEGLNALDTQTGECIRFSHDPTNPGGLSNNTVNFVYWDRKGSLWVETSGGGINKYESGKRQCIHVREEPDNPTSLKSKIVRSMVEDKRGAVWMATYGEGVDVYDRHTGKFRHYLHDPLNERSLSHNVAFSLYQDIDGSIWVGTSEGLNRIDPLTGYVTRHYSEPVPPHNHPMNTITDIYRDPNGTLWVGTASRPMIVNLKEKRFDPFLDRSLYYRRTGRMLGDRDRRTLWMATENDGLLRFDLKTRDVKQFLNNPNDPTSISCNCVKALCEDPNKPGAILWVATNGGGLNRFDKSAGTFTRYMKTGGLVDNQIYEMAFDGRGNLWLRTETGLSRFDPKTGVCRSYDYGDGIAPDRVTALMLSRTGEFIAATTKGITIFHPDSLRDNSHIPPIVLTDFRITNKSVLPGELNSPLSKTITETKQIVLSYLDNVISFDFAALDYVMPEKNQYAYKLVGFDKDWIHSGNVRTATYTNLDPGEYVFRVKGSNNDGIWNEEGTSLSIIITPPWWKTTWAYGVYGFLLASLLYSGYRTRLRQLYLKHHAEMEHFQVEHLAEVDRLKSRFFANISHEFRTPLTLILGPADQGLELTEEPSTRQKLHIIRDNARKLLGLVNQLLDFSRLESGMMGLQVSSGDIVQFLRRVVMSFESWAERKHIGLEFRSDAESILGHFDADKLEKIVNNLISNALKFTPEGGEVTVAFTQFRIQNSELRTRSSAPPSFQKGGSEQVRISVSDTGPGIPDEHLPHIFDRFYRVDETHATEGTGIGLALTKELVDLHHGTITVESTPGNGSVFTVTFPIERSAYSPDEITESVPQIERREHAEAEGSSEEPGPVPTRAPTVGKPIVLIVEDNADLRTYIREYLQADYSVLEEGDGKEGYERATEIVPDLVISDIMMPQMDGMELCRALKQDVRTSHVPVILLTARAGTDSKIEGLEIGADDYLTKPFETKELGARVRNLIEQRRKLREKFSAGVVLKPGEVAVTSLDDALLKRVMGAVEQGMSNEEFGVEDLSREVALGRRQLERKLQGLTGLSPAEFIRTMRLQRAHELLAKNVATVSEIAFQVGFGSPSYFSSCFRERFGYPPSEMHRQRS